MTASLADGWLTVPYAGHDATVVRLAVTRSGTEPDWQPAFLDYIDGQRVAKIRPPADVPHRAQVQMRVGGVVTSHGRYPA